jgi:hypothetical protein
VSLGAIMVGVPTALGGVGAAGRRPGPGLNPRGEGGASPSPPHQREPPPLMAGRRSEL